jgi:hypothetical protein
MNKAALQKELINISATLDTLFNDKEADSLLSFADDEDALQGFVAEIIAKGQSLRSDIQNILDSFEPEHDSNDLEAIAATAKEFDESGDPFLQKQAQVLDTVLSIFANKDFAKLAEEDNATDKLREKYRKRDQEEKYNKPTEYLKDKTSKTADRLSNALKESTDVRPMDVSLNTRYCPDHVGVGLIYVGEGTYQCSLDKKIFDFKEGYKNANGKNVPGFNVADQNKIDNSNIDFKANFDTREGRMNRDK